MLTNEIASLTSNIKSTLSMQDDLKFELPSKIEHEYIGL